ncbi:hypothetical protein C6P44_003092 [Monosporozyma unispora]|nr:hypothetical protein C6P44_003092 [Kazachstania unispora]
MKPTLTRLATHYKPSIKFVGTRHTVFPKKAGEEGKIIPHPCSLDGILPGSKECVPIPEFLKNQLPLTIKPYVAPIQIVESPYSFVNRPLGDNEVDSIFKLPPKYQSRPIEVDECDVINAGGAF